MMPFRYFAGTVLFEKNHTGKSNSYQIEGNGFIDFGPYIKSFEALGIYIYMLKDQLTDMIANPEKKLMESDVSKASETIPTQGVAESTYFKAPFHI